MAIIKYSGRGDTGSISNDGGKTWNSLGGSGNSPSGGNGGNQGNTGSSGNMGSTTVNSAGTTWNNYNGATGKQYSVAGSNGTIRVTQKDGSTRTVLPTSGIDFAELNVTASLTVEVEVKVSLFPDTDTLIPPVVLKLKSERILLLSVSVKVYFPSEYFIS